MQSSNEQVPGLSLLGEEISPEVLVSLATVPFLLVLLGSKALDGVLQDIGQQSEELFRGDRLPFLGSSSSTSDQL